MNTDYAYIVGRLRAIETRLLTPNLMERMIDASSAEDAFRTLNDLTFISGSIGDYAVSEFQKVLTASIKKMLWLLAKMAPYPEVAKCFWLKYDFHNLKVALKARLVEHGYADIKHALIDLGSFSAEVWEHFVLEGRMPPLTKGMHETIQDASQQYEKTEDPQIVDMIVDRHYLEEMLLLAQKLDSALTISYLKRLIDLTNLKTFIRCKELKKEESYFEAVLLEGGHISFDAFTGSYKKSYEDLRMALEQKMHSIDLIGVLDEFVKEGSLLSAEKKMSELLQKFMEESRRISFGPEPVFAFFWKFENHIQILRTIFIGKLNSLPVEEIQKQVITL